MADSRKPKRPGDKKPPSGGPNPQKPGSGNGGGQGPFPWSNAPKPGNPPTATPQPGFAWKWNGQAWVETRLTKDEKPTQKLPDGYEWVWDDATGWGFRQTNPVTDPTDPVTDPTDPPADPPAPPGLDAGTVNARKSAREYLDGLFKQFGFSDADRAKLLGEVDGWITEGLADAGTDAILMKFRGTTIYQNRFAGMAELIKRGQAISEAEYIQLESSYRNVMQNYGIKDTYYNSYDDFARLIGAGLSPKEVEERVVAAKQAMNPLVAAELKQYYNVTEGDLTAYMLGLTDGKGLLLESARTQEQIRKEGRAAQIGAAAERAGFAMDQAFAEGLGGTSLGQTIDPFQMGTLANLEGTFDQARRVADRETTLSAIDSEAYDQRDALSAAFGDEQKKLASERRARRERARFSGSSGVAGASLGVERNI